MRGRSAARGGGGRAGRGWRRSGGAMPGPGFRRRRTAPAKPAQRNPPSETRQPKPPNRRPLGLSPSLSPQAFRPQRSPQPVPAPACPRPGLSSPRPVPAPACPRSSSASLPHPGVPLPKCRNILGVRGGTPGWGARACGRAAAPIAAPIPAQIRACRCPASQTPATARSSPIMMVGNSASQKFSARAARWAMAGVEARSIATRSASIPGAILPTA